MAETALITGATGGLGRAMAEELAKRGVCLVLTARDEGKLREMAQKLEAKYRIETDIFSEDLCDLNAPVRLWERLKEQGATVDILVNNAGFGDFGDYLDANWERQEEMIQVNILALMRLTRLFAPEMAKRRHGRILNVSSMAGFAPGPHLSVYYASKAFVLSFSQALHEEMRDMGVSVTALCPGPTKTGFEKAAGLQGESKLFQVFPNAPASRVAACGVKALYAGKAIVIPGVANKLLAFVTRMAPRSLMRRVVGSFQRAVRSSSVS